MSHNSKYYVKKLCKKDIKGQQKIGDVFKKTNKGNDQSSEIKSEIRQVLDYIITEVCNEVEIDNPSKTKEVSSPQALITHSLDCNNENLLILSCSNGWQLEWACTYVQGLKGQENGPLKIMKIKLMNCYDLSCYPLY